MTDDDRHLIMSFLCDEITVNTQMASGVTNLTYIEDCVELTRKVEDHESQAEATVAFAEWLLDHNFGGGFDLD